MEEEICPECGKKIEFIVAPDADSSRAAPMGDTYACEESARSCAAIAKRGIWEQLNEPLPRQVLRRVDLYVLPFIPGLLAYGLLMGWLSDTGRTGAGETGLADGAGSPPLLFAATLNPRERRR